MKLWSGSRLQIRWFVPSLELERGFKAAGSVERVEWRDAVGGFQRFNGLLMVHSECIFRWSVRACYHQWGDGVCSDHGNVMCYSHTWTILFLWGPMFDLFLPHWCTGYCFCPLPCCVVHGTTVLNHVFGAFHHHVCCFAAQFITSFVICVIVFHCMLPRLPAWGD